MIGVGEDFPFDFAPYFFDSPGAWSHRHASPASPMHNTAEDGAYGGLRGESFTTLQDGPQKKVINWG